MNFEQVFKACRRELKYQALGTVEGSKIGPLHIPFVLAPVGIGKTDLAKALAIDTELPHLHINAGEASTGVDITGVPLPTQVSKKDWKTVWAPNEALFVATQEPVLLHFDDADKARIPAQNALIGLLGERKFRNTKLHPGTLIILTGNRTEDDMYAIQISESVRTRTTQMILEPSALHFAKWGRDTGLIHPLLIGYVTDKPDHIHVISKTGDRHTTPRGYREASDQLFHESEKDWKEILELKLGSAVANDIFAYYLIYSRVDVDHIMATGEPRIPPAERNQQGELTFDPSNASHVRRFNYAALFAVSQALNNEKYIISASTTPGIPKFVDNLKKEMAVAFAVQLTEKSRARISNVWEKTGALLIDPLVN